MKNPLKEKDYTGLLLAAAAALAAGTGVWLYLRRKRAGALEAYRHEHALDYLKDRRQKIKKHRSDVYDLANLVHHEQN